MFPSNSIVVKKSDGSHEPFNREKLRQSLKNSGVSDAVALEVAAHVEKELVNGMTTSDIYRHAFSVLHSRQKQASVRYSLRRSLLSLGPTGFPFEKFVGEIFKRKGFSVQVDQMVQGKCIDHEVDVVAWNEKTLLMVEAKYHHELAYKSDVKVALYIKARFDDLLASTFHYGTDRKLNEAWLITNTKFTEKAIAYAECSGVRLIGWNYPTIGNLHDLIEETGVHPVTSLTSLSDNKKQQLMKQGIVLCESIRTQKDRLRAIGLSDDLIAQTVAESDSLCPA